MFAGGRRRSSNNVRAMQLFHELKQQFPTVPDHVVSACLAGGDGDDDARRCPPAICEVLEAAVTLHQELMGRNPNDDDDGFKSNVVQRSCWRVDDSKKSDSKVNDGVKDDAERPSDAARRTRNEMNQPKRPDTLDIGNDASGIRQSEKCKDVHKLLNANRPPRSPQAPKRHVLKGQRFGIPTGDSSETKKTDKPQTVETPTQTTGTLLTPSRPSVNVSLNVNCSVGQPKRTTALHMVPQQPWCQEPASPRSYTSVNLTLRPPSSEPQPPIDITSRNSSLTYSTSTFDSQKGLQSKLQITVGPNGGSVSSVRTRPRSFHAEEDARKALHVGNRVSSLQDLSTTSDASTALTPPVLKRQQARIDRLRIELRSEKMKLVAMQTEVARLEDASRRDVVVSDRTDAELEKQLVREIRHLRGQCERLTIEVDRQTENGVPLGETNEEFYRNIYVGQRGPTDFGRPLDHQRRAAEGGGARAENFGPKWSCPLCTFQNHPLLDKCEQCDMARIVHGTPRSPAPDKAGGRTLSDLLGAQASRLDASDAVSAANSLLQYVTGSPEFVRRQNTPEGGDVLP